MPSWSTNERFFRRLGKFKNRGHSDCGSIIMCVKFSEFQLKTIRGDTHCGVTQTVDNSEWADGSTLFWFNCITSDKLTLAGFSHLLLVTKLRDADVVLVKAEHVFAVLHK